VSPPEIGNNCHLKQVFLAVMSLSGNAIVRGTRRGHFEVVAISVVLIVDGLFGMSVSPSCCLIAILLIRGHNFMAAVVAHS